MIDIYDFCYQLHTGKIRCCGTVVNHPKFPANHFVFISLPVYFNEDELELDTISGSHYKIHSFFGDEDECINQLKLDISRKSYESISTRQI